MILFLQKMIVSLLSILKFFKQSGHSRVFPFEIQFHDWAEIPIYKTLSVVTSDQHGFDICKDREFFKNQRKHVGKVCFTLEDKFGVFSK